MLGRSVFAGRVVADRTVPSWPIWWPAAMKTMHLTGVNWGRDCAEPEVADMRNVVEGDASPDGQGVLALCLALKWAMCSSCAPNIPEAMGATYLDRDGKQQVMEMGCWHWRVAHCGAAIEQNFDERSIIFTDAMAPFTVSIVPMGYRRSEAVQAAADALYAELKAAGVDVLLDDRRASACCWLIAS